MGLKRTKERYKPKQSRNFLMRRKRSRSFVRAAWGPSPSASKSNEKLVKGQIHKTVTKSNEQKWKHFISLISTIVNCMPIRYKIVKIVSSKDHQTS